MEEKDLEYYQGLDKRSKEYKEWKAKFDANNEGLGDRVAKITKSTGLDKVAEKVADALGFEDCGCDERRERWNKKFRFGKPECFTEEEYLFLKDFFSVRRVKVSFEERKSVYDIYNRVFRTNLRVTSCSSCWAEKVKRLTTLLSDYE